MYNFSKFFGLTPLVLISICNVLSGELMTSDWSPSMHFVEMVQKRCYLIHRLEKSVKFLLHINEVCKDKKSHLCSFLQHQSNALISMSHKFSHPSIVRCIRAIEQHHDITKINRIWSDFVAYKFFDSDLFVQETIAAIVLLYKELVAQLLPKESIRNEATVASTGPCEVTLSGMRIAENEVRDHFSVLLNILNESDDQVDFVLANNMRFYHIKRLTKTVDILLKYHLSPANTAMVCDFTQVPFKHERIQACVRKVKEMQNYKPIFFLWQHDFVSYRGINDVLFLQEFITLLLLIGRSSCHSNMKKMPTAKEVITLYNAIAALPIPELLNSLDAIVDQLTELLDGYELDAAMSWKSWLSKYWWVPPVVVASCIVNFFLQKGLPADNTVNLDF